MTEQEREELIEKMAKAAWESDGTTCDLLLEIYLTEARAALAIAEPVIREQADNALREENARLQGLLREAHVKMEVNNLWSNLRHRVAAAIREGGEDRYARG